MEYVIGIDGGGTGTRLTVLDGHMAEVFSCSGGGAAVNSMPESDIRAHLAALIDDFSANFGPGLWACRGACLGAAGAGRKSGKEKLLTILADCLPGVPVFVTTDSAGALRGAFSGGDGVLVAAGTGSICTAKRGEAFHRSGGWGHVLGDEGSGYDIGRQILQAIARAADGREGATVLTRMVWAEWGVQDMDGLVEKVCSGEQTKSDIAGLAFFSQIAYNMGDEAARRILNRAAESLAEMALCAATALWGPEESPPCAYAGGVLEHFPALRALFRRALGEKRPDMPVHACEHTAAWGCASLAWEQAEGPAGAGRHDWNDHT